MQSLRGLAPPLRRSDVFDFDYEFDFELAYFTFKNNWRLS